MIRAIDEKMGEIERLCEEYRVRRLAVFGSSAEGTPGAPPNDLDLVVEFEPMAPAEYADCYFGLMDELERIFECPVDLVEYSPIRNPYFRQAIETTQVVLYAAA